MKTLIVGGGPAGSLTAIMLGKKSDVVIAEDHQSPGYPVQCAGLISDICYKKYGEFCKIKKAMENEIKGAFFFSPSGNHIEARGKAYVVERKILDAMLFEKASEKADVFIKSKVRFNGRKAVIGNSEIVADIIVGADGIGSAVAKNFGFEQPGVFTAVQAEMKFEPLDDGFVELYFGWSDFFAYAIPLGDTARIGVISRNDPYKLFKNLIEKHPSVSERIKGSVIELNAGGFPDRLVNFVKGNVALIGDSAGMVKPYTGGGLYYLLVAAETLNETFPNLELYRQLYLKRLGREYRFGERIRRLYSLDNRSMEELFRLMRDFDFRGVHMDSPSTLLASTFKILLRLLKNPGIAFSVIRLLL
ncbi:NAD(P)/FAD-dependent oxidoreductase [Archaeoglobus neptunius]|uniref:NAD(P)/FAD-dependent oxidoreductase n=1 Tax=Archaeoglobus neptunius TaxID=2798580 RepID=UPI0019261940|nr:NAD(P)/FAD-dependent oxidoreductase [Archaeoglobus neptunius]